MTHFLVKMLHIHKENVVYLTLALVDKGQIQPDDSTPADRTEAQEDTDYTGQFVKAKLLPETADILIAYSSVPGNNCCN